MSAAPLRRRAPVRRPAPARRPAQPVRKPAAPARGLIRPTGAAVLDRLLSGRLWIGLVFLLLVGIVFFNVDLLRMNRDIAVTAEKAETVKRQNARLRGDLARLGSSERIQKVAAESGLVLPAPGEVRYLTPNPEADARNALTRLKAGPGTDAQAEIPPAQSGQGASGDATAQAPVTTPQTTTPQATTQPTPTAAPQPATAPQQTAPAAQPSPVSTGQPPAATTTAPAGQ
jgi:cell division protein FtsL